MISTICNYLLEHQGIVGITVVIAIIVFLIGWKLSEFYNETKKVNKSFPEIKDKLSSIDSSLNTLNTILIEKEIIKSSIYSQANSPRIVNESGKKVYQQSGAKNILEENSNNLINELEKLDNRSLLKLEQNCLKVMISKMNTDEFKPIQDFAFQNPNFQDKPLTYTDILYIMSIYLRDIYINKHPELKEAK